MNSAPSILLICENALQSDALASLVRDIATCARRDGRPPPNMPTRGLRGVIVNIDLTSPASVASLGRNLTLPAYRDIPRLFVAPRSSHHAVVQATALGATAIAVRPTHRATIRSFVLAASRDPADAQPSPSCSLQSGVIAAHGVMAMIFDGIPAGRPLSFDDIVAAETKIINALQQTTLQTWLATVDRHHNNTYRHCLYVTGIAVAFAQHLKLNQTDQRRVTRCALLHDVGKALIPLSILNKPGRLNDREYEVMKMHPKLGFDWLAGQKQFLPETLDAVLSHHEYLDGSGYPYGVSGSQISDLVRITTISDIYAALTENRSYHASRSPRLAYNMMAEMGPRIDQQLLKAFQPLITGIRT